MAQLPLLSEGLMAARFARSEEMQSVIDGLREHFGDTPGVEIRQFIPEHLQDGSLVDAAAGPKVRLIKTAEITHHEWPTDQPLQPALEQVEAAIPSLTRPLPVTFVGIGRAIDTGYTHRSHLHLTIDNKSTDQLTAERHQVLRTLEEATGTPPNPRWKRRQPNMTLVSVEPEVGPLELARMGHYLSSLLPLAVDLSPTKFFPDPRTNS
jgi:hypothetical protein